MSEDKVRLIDQERLDLPDARDLQGLVYTYVREAIGGLMGQAQGCLSAPTWTLADDGVTYTVTPSSFVFIQTDSTLASAEPQGAVTINARRAWDGIVHTFDSSQSGHVNYPIDYTAARAAEIATPGTRPYIWARPFELDSDTDTRRVWDVGTQTEIPTPINTRTRMRVEFEVSETTPAGSGWAKVAKINAWSAVTFRASVINISAWDDPDLADLTQDPNPDDPLAEASSSMAGPLYRTTYPSDLTGTDDAGNDGTVSDYAPGVNRSAGLLYHLHRVRSQIRAIISGGTSDDPATLQKSWWARPTLSLQGLKVVTDGLTSYVNAIATPLFSSLSASIAALENRQVIIAAGVLRWRPAGLYGAPYAGEGWSLAQGWGVDRVDTGATTREVSIKLLSTVVTGRTGYYVSAVNVTPIRTPGLLSANNYGGLVLLPKMIPDPYGVSPATWGPAGTLNDYRGAAVGLAAGEYGVALVMYRQRVPIGDEAVLMAEPANGEIQSELAFAFQVVISTYRYPQAGA